MCRDGVSKATWIEVGMKVVLYNNIQGHGF